ncbi:dephospho-CoA kinase [Mariniflexile ostreae]|uniref:Dephospho-CoA kinase n=1 Tax=Mariniflexile ostreae TaxID=1520892 RepID=A0ABV5FEN1_9FLAO
MIIVGLTGGIGSGKTTVARAFSALGVPVYIADEEAKKLMQSSKEIKQELVALFGEQAYNDQGLNRSFLADIIFKDKAYLKKMNAIVHPRVAKHFEKWTSKQKAPYVIKEVAILFENGGYTLCDVIITVVAPKDLKIKRLLSRDNTTVEKIEAIMANQWNDDKKVELSHYVIENIDFEKIKMQVLEVHGQILEKIK